MFDHAISVNFTIVTDDEDPFSENNVALIKEEIEKIYRAAMASPDGELHEAINMECWDTAESL